MQIVSEQADHRVGDMFKWKERVHKKHEMKREVINRMNMNN